jgi:hypothetical protein
LSLQRTWERLDNLLSTALAAEEHRLASRHVDLAREFIEHNEFGLAYEMLIHGLEEADAVAGSEAALLLEEAAKLMKL